MKPHHRFLTAAFTVALSTASAQTVDTSTGTVLDSTSAPSAPPRDMAPAMKLRAAIVPMDQDSKMSGHVQFSLIGDAVNVTGQIEGLEPNKRYQLQIDRPAPAAEERADKAPDGSPAAGTPAAGAPDATAPAAGTPAAGKPDGSSRPGAPGGGTSGTSGSGSRSARTEASDREAFTPGSSTGDLGMMTADSTGAMNVSAILRNADLTAGPMGILGRTVGIMPAAESGSTSAPAPIATGVIGKAEAVEPAP